MAASCVTMDVCRYNGASMSKPVALNLGYLFRSLSDSFGRKIQHFDVCVCCMPSRHLQGSDMPFAVYRGCSLSAHICELPVPPQGTNNLLPWQPTKIGAISLQWLHNARRVAANGVGFLALLCDRQCHLSEHVYTSKDILSHQTSWPLNKLDTEQASHRTSWPPNMLATEQAGH